MVLHSGGASTDQIPPALKRSRCVKNSSPLNTPNQNGRTILEAEWSMYADIDDNEIISAAKMPTTTPWISRSSAAPPRRSLSFVSKPTPVSVKDQLLRQIQPTNGKRPRKRGRSSKVTESEDEAERCASDINDDEVRSEDDTEPSSGDERFVAADDDEEEDDEESEESAVSTDDESSQSDYSEGEAEFSCDDEESDAEEVPVEPDMPEDEDDGEIEVLGAVPMTKHERRVMAVSVAAQQIARRLNPLMIAVDSHVINILVCMFWAIHNPGLHDVETLADALPSALSLIMENRHLSSADTTVGACYVWLINHGKLRRNLIENYESPALEEWLEVFLSSHTMNDTPVFVYEKKKERRCFLSGAPCNRGVRLNDNTTKEELATLWFDAANETTNAFVLNIVRYLFLPATITEFCTLYLGEHGTFLDEEKTALVHQWITDLAGTLSFFLYEEGVARTRSGTLDMELTRNYVK